MAFVQVQRRWGGARLASSVTSSIYAGGGSLILNIRIGTEVQRQLDWGRDQRATYLFGIGEDSGRARLEPSETGNRPSFDGSCNSYRTGRLPPDLTRIKRGSETCNYVIAGNALIVDLPGDWFEPPIRRAALTHPNTL